MCGAAATTRCERGAGNAAFEGRCRDMLTMLIGEAALAFETLPLIQDAQILRNILYSGVWTRYALLQEKRRQKERKNS